MTDYKLNYHPQYDSPAELAYRRRWRENVMSNARHFYQQSQGVNAAQYVHDLRGVAARVGRLEQKMRDYLDEHQITDEPPFQHEHGQQLMHYLHNLEESTTKLAGLLYMAKSSRPYHGS